MASKVRVLFLIFVLLLSSCEIEKDTLTDIKLSDNSWAGDIFPPEHEIVEDSVSGAKLIFVTSDSSQDLNLYFDYNCWFSDLSVMFFTSNRTGQNELFGYVRITGELIKVSPGSGEKYWFATVDFKTYDIYVHTDSTILRWNVGLTFNSDSTCVKKVEILESLIATAPNTTKFTSSITQSADLQFISATLTDIENPNKKEIVSVNINSGKINSLMSFNTDTAITHVQFNKYIPNLLRYSRDVPRNIGIHRMWVVDVRNPGVSRKIYLQGLEESVTHEDWWINDQLTFCAGYRRNEYHVKVIDINEQNARIIGAGAWWEGASDKELAKRNWWHASGSRNGRWVAADNWHGDIAIIDSRTSQLHILTSDHRTYGGGNHPHVGWAPDSKSVEFTSNAKGNSDVCIAYLPLNKWESSFLK